MQKNPVCFIMPPDNSLRNPVSGYLRRIIGGERAGGDQGPQGTFRDGGYAYYLDCGEISWVYTYFKTHQIIHLKYVHFHVLQLYLHTWKGTFPFKNEDTIEVTIRGVMPK